MPTRQIESQPVYPSEKLKLKLEQEPMRHARPIT